MALSSVGMFEVASTSCDGHDVAILRQLMASLENEFSCNVQLEGDAPTLPLQPGGSTPILGATELNVTIDFVDNMSCFLPVTFRVIGLNDEKIRLVRRLAPDEHIAARFKAIVSKIGGFQDVVDERGRKAHAFAAFESRLANSKVRHARRVNDDRSTWQ